MLCSTSGGKSSWSTGRFAVKSQTGYTEMVNCPNCDAVLDVEEDELDEGDELTCEECGSNVAVTSTDPLELESVEDDEEDEDEDEDDDDLDDDDVEEDEEDDDEWK